MPTVKRSIILLAAAVVVGLSLGAASCGTTADNMSDNEIKAEVHGACPGTMSVGVLAELTVRVKNTGITDWPVTFLTFSKGLDSFVVNNIRMGSLVGRKANTPSFDSYQIGTGAGLRAGKSGTIHIEMVPREAKNLGKLSFSVWGGKPGERSIPSSIEFVACEDLAINP